MTNTLLSAKELANRIHFSAGYINKTLKDSVLLEGLHYIRPFGGRKILYIWEAVEHEIFNCTVRPSQIIPMASGRICNG